MEILLKKINRYGISCSNESELKEILDSEMDILYLMKREPACFFKFASERIKSEIRVIKCLLQNEPSYFQSLKNEIKMNLEFIKECISEKIPLFEYIPYDFKSVSLAKLELEFDYRFLLNSPNDIKKNREIGLIVAERYPFYLRYLSSNIKDDKEIVLKAAERFGNVIEYVSLRLRDDEEVIETAINNIPYSIMYASDRLKKKRKFNTNPKISYLLPYYSDYRTGQNNYL